MQQSTSLSRSAFLSRSFFSGTIFFFVFAGWALVTIPRAAAQMAMPQETLADLVKPSIVRIAEHVSGTAKIPAIKVDIRKRLVAVVPDAYTEVPVDEYLVGSGFIIHPDGYIATNSHVVSQETVKQMLASDNALSALYENALFLSDAEMQEFIQSETENSFSKKVLQYVIEHSIFELKSEVAVLRPDSLKRNMADLLAEGFQATMVSVNDNFLEDEKDVALLKIEETNLPALSLGSGEELAVGKKAYIFGFPATAELNQNNSLEATFTQGVISAIKQSANKDFKLFQTDAKVSEGSSGGPLFDERGDVAGIITFQTDELSRGQGDNFAFALPIEMIKKAALEAGVPLAEGTYSKNFKVGFAQFSGKHCDKAVASFEAAKETNAFFGVEKYVEPYLKKCETLKQSGTSLDTRWDELRGGIGALGNPFFYLVGIGLILFGIFGAAIFWLLRQVLREENEIVALEDRLRADEIRIRAYKTGNVSPELNKYVGLKKDTDMPRHTGHKKVV